MSIDRLIRGSGGASPEVRPWPGMVYGVAGDEWLADRPECSLAAAAVRAGVGEPAPRPYNPACAAEEVEGIDMGAIIFGATAG